MNSIQKLTEFFSEFPGIGSRQARRFVYYLLTRNPTAIEEFVAAVKDLRGSIHECILCHQFFQKNSSNSRECDICLNPMREHKTLIIISRDVDLQNIEKTHAFSGKYFVLGGSVPILEKNPDHRIRSQELKRIVETYASRKEDKLEEIILAMNATPDGENTGDYVETLLSPLAEKYGFKISHLGRGISTGTEIEYSDSDTIKNALKNRS